MDIAFERAKKVLKESGSSLAATRDDLEESLDHHLRAVRRWSQSISFSDLRGPKFTDQVFVDLKLFISPRRVRIEDYEEIERIDITDLIRNLNGHVVILGHPGAGKTTSMKRLCQLLLSSDELQVDRFAFPILIKFRELKDPGNDTESTVLIDRPSRSSRIKAQFSGKNCGTTAGQTWTKCEPDTAHRRSARDANTALHP